MDSNHFNGTLSSIMANSFVSYGVIARVDFTTLETKAKDSVDLREQISA